MSRFGGTLLLFSLPQTFNVALTQDANGVAPVNPEFSINISVPIVIRPRSELLKVGEGLRRGKGERG